MHRLTVIIIALLVVGAAAQPPVAHNDPAWESAAADFTTALLDPTGSSQPATALAPDAAIHTFGGEASPLLRLQAALSDSTVLGTYGYTLPATSIADDIAEAVSASALPDEIKRQMAPSAQSRPRANAIALQWVSRALRAGEGECIAVMILAPNTIGDAPATDGETLFTFVLFKGSKTASGEYRVTTIVYGDPLSGER